MTELDVQAQDENRRADFYEKALRALYGHPSVEGILFWGFWDQAHWRGEKAALVRGNNLDVSSLFFLCSSSAPHVGICVVNSPPSSCERTVSWYRIHLDKQTVRLTRISPVCSECN